MYIDSYKETMDKEVMEQLKAYTDTFSEHKVSCHHVRAGRSYPDERACVGRDLQTRPLALPLPASWGFCGTLCAPAPGLTDGLGMLAGVDGVCRKGLRSARGGSWTMTGRSGPLRLRCRKARRRLARSVAVCTRDRVA